MLLELLVKLLVPERFPMKLLGEVKFLVLLPPKGLEKLPVLFEVEFVNPALVVKLQENSGKIVLCPIGFP